MFRDIYKEFFEAIYNNEIKTVNNLLNSPNGEILKNSYNSHGKTPLYIAAKNGFTEIAKKLISHGLNKNITHNGKTPLVAAIINGHIEIVKLLIASGVDLEGSFMQMHYNTSPLVESIKNGHVEIVKLLIEAGIELDGLSMKEYFPLYYAIQYNQMDIVRLLVSHKVDLPIKMVEWSTEEGGIEKRLVWNRRCTGYIDIPKAFYPILISGLLADSIYEKNDVNVNKYSNNEINNHVLTIRLKNLLQSNYNSANYNSANPNSTNFPKIDSFFFSFMYFNVKNFIEYIKATDYQITKTLEKPLSKILNHKFPDNFPSGESYSVVLSKNRSQNIDPNTRKNLESYQNDPNLIPYQFFQRMLQENNQNEILSLFLEYPEEADLIFKGLKDLILEKKDYIQIDNLEKNFVKHKCSNMNDITEYSYVVDKKFNEVTNNENGNNQYFTEKLDSIDTTGKFTSNILRNRNNKTLSSQSI